MLVCGMPFALMHSRETSRLETRKAFDPGVPSLKTREPVDVRGRYGGDRSVRLECDFFVNIG
jgi:hypothetical protein